MTDKTIVDTEGPDSINKAVEGLEVVMPSVEHEQKTEAIRQAVMGSGKNILVVDSVPDAYRAERAEADKKMADKFLAACLGVWGVPMGILAKNLGGHSKPKQKCGLPGCDKLGEKDYCCAEHCKQHREMRKAHKDARSVWT